MRPSDDHEPRDPARTWPIAVRRARPDDRAGVLAFASTTFDGWDYIAEVWDDWVADSEGALLLATAECSAAGEVPRDAAGAAMEPGRVVGLMHLRRLSPTEGWIEGIRVDPAVRGLAIATDLDRAALDLARRQGIAVVRYLTGTRNEASLRLAARLGLRPIGAWRFHGRGREDDRMGPAGRAMVEQALARAVTDGWPPAPDADAAAWFARLTRDPTVQAGHGLYEHHPWAFQRLTPELLTGHLRAREVLALGPADDGHWALLIINRERSLDEGELWPALLAGEGGMVVRLLDRLGGEPGPLARLRLPDPAPMLDGHASAWGHLGYGAHEGTMVVVEGDLGAAGP